MECAVSRDDGCCKCRCAGGLKSGRDLVLRRPGDHAGRGDERECEVDVVVAVVIVIVGCCCWLADMQAELPEDGLKTGAFWPLWVLSGDVTVSVVVAVGAVVVVVGVVFVVAVVVVSWGTGVGSETFVFVEQRGDGVFAVVVVVAGVVAVAVVDCCAQGRSTL